MSRTALGVPVNQFGLRASWMGPHLIVENITWNEIGPRVTSRGPLIVCDTKRFAREAEKGPLWERKIRTRNYVIGLKSVHKWTEGGYAGAGVLDNGKGPCREVVHALGAPTRPMFTRTKIPASCGQRSAECHIKWFACEWEKLRKELMASRKSTMGVWVPSEWK